MIKDLKMELLNSEQAEAIYGGGTPDDCTALYMPCETPDSVDRPCATGVIPHPEPIPCQLQNQLSKWSGIISADRYEFKSVK